MNRTIIAASALSAALAGAAPALAGMPPQAMGSGQHALARAASQPSPMAAHEGHAAAAASLPRWSLQLHKAVVRVVIRNFAFQPAHLVVSRGTRVVWVNRDGDPHTVATRATRSAGGWASEALDTGNRFGRVMSRAGSFAYICTIHPFMHGTVVVKP